MLELDKVTRRFGERIAVADATIAIPAGQMVGIIGRSGAGKSTLLRMVNRLLEPSEGRLLFDGRDITRLRGSALHAWRASAAMMFQQFNLVPRLDVLTNVLAGRLNRIPTARALLKLFTMQRTRPGDPCPGSARHRRSRAEPCGRIVGRAAATGGDRAGADAGAAPAARR